MFPHLEGDLRSLVLKKGRKNNPDSLIKVIAILILDFIFKVDLLKVYF